MNTPAPDAAADPQRADHPAAAQTPAKTQTKTQAKTRRRWLRSLRWRLLLATALAMAIALALAGLLLVELFRSTAQRQLEQGLADQLDQLTAAVEIAPDGNPVVNLQRRSDVPTTADAAQRTIDTDRIIDHHWSQPYSGHYWQVDLPDQPGWQSSRSLWDVDLPPPPATIERSDAVVFWRGIGPKQQPLLIATRRIGFDDAPKSAPSLVSLHVAINAQELDVAVDQFTTTLTLSLAGLLLLMLAAALAQVAVGLAPLRALQAEVAALRDGRAHRLTGEFPLEVQPLIDDFNRVLDHDDMLVTRARTHAGNLAHALKTPLTVIDQAAQQVLQAASSVDAAATTADPQATDAATHLARLAYEQVQVARRHVDWHLARSRAAAAHQHRHLATPVAGAINSLVRVMHRVHAHKDLLITVDERQPQLAFAGEQQDLLEMLGNLIDNACQWAQSEVAISVDAVAPEPGQPRLRQLRIVIDDDGPGLPTDARTRVLQRGVRLDESVPGSGLGLAITDELAQLYQGSLTLNAVPAAQGGGERGGLRVVLVLPMAVVGSAV